MSAHNPLFTGQFLDSYLSGFQLSNLVNIYQIKEVIGNWNQVLANGKLENLKEEEVKSRFLMEFFGDVLGFNYKNSGKWLYREEVKTLVDGTKPDGALGLFHVSEKGIENQIQIIIEVKDTNTVLDKAQNRQALKITPVDQAFLYASKMGMDCQWIVVTNLKEIRFYHAGDQTRYQLYTLSGLLNEHTLKELLFLFHRDRFFTGSISPTAKLFALQKRQKHSIATQRHIVDELYFCLQRFDQLSFVDPIFLANIKPFNVLDVRVWHFEHHRLFTLNPEIYELLKGLEIKQGDLLIDLKLETTLKAAGITEYRMKLEYIFKKLSNSHVQKISALADLENLKQKNKGTIGFSYRHSVPVNKDSGINFDLDFSEKTACTCINCQYRSLDFCKMITYLDSRDGKKEAETLDVAYGHYLLATDNYRKAYRIYKNIENDSKGNDKRFIEYFLTKRNLLHLQHLFFDDPEYAEYKKESRGIDLDRILSDEIDLFVDEDVRKILLEIKEDKVFTTSIGKSAVLLKEIKDVKSLYDRGGKMLACPNYLNNLSEEYLQVFGHIHKNCIIQDVYSTYADLVATVFQGLVYSFQTKGTGVETFTDFYLIEAVLYLAPDKLKEILADVEVLPMKEDYRKKFTDKALAYFQSSFHDGIFGDPRRDELIEKQLLNHRFRDKYTNVFSNLCILLARMSYTSEEFEPVASAMVKFLKVEQVMAWWDIKKFGELIKKRGELFSSAQLLELLALATSSHRYNNNKYSTLIPNVSVALRKFYPHVTVENLQLVKRAVLNCHSDEHRADFTPLIDLWHILTETNKNYLSQAFEEYLDANFSDHLYEQLLKNKVIPYNRKDYLAKFAEQINRTKGIGYTGMVNGIAEFNDFVCYNFLLVPYILDLSFDLAEFKLLTTLSPFERWLANPVDFDYQDFKAEWLKAARSTYILNRLKGNENIRLAIAEELKANFDKQLAKVYFKYFAGE